jgi:hypothetical protein
MIDKSVRMAIAATSGVNLKEYEKEADGTVCKLWDEIREDGIAQGADCEYPLCTKKLLQCSCPALYNGK